MARVSRQFAADFELVTQTYVARREMTQDEAETMRERVRVELSPGPGLPAPRDSDGNIFEGWSPMTHEERIAAYTETFSRLAGEIRSDIARSERIRAEVRAEKGSA
jgi:hypothetical protein